MLAKCWNGLFRNICKMLKTYTISGKTQGKRKKIYKKLISSEQINGLVEMQPFPEVWSVWRQFFISIWQPPCQYVALSPRIEVWLFVELRPSIWLLLEPCGLLVFDFSFYSFLFFGLVFFQLLWNFYCFNLLEKAIKACLRLNLVIIMPLGLGLFFGFAWLLMLWF